MAGLLAAEVVAVLAHVLENVAVADRGADEGEAEIAEIALEAEIGHDRRDDAVLRQAAVLAPGAGDDAHELVAVDDVALLVDDEDAVGVAVEGDADIGAQFADLADQRLRRRRADLLVDVEAVGLDAHGDDLGAELPERLGRDLVGGAVGAIEHDPHAVEARLPRQGALGELDVAGRHAVDALRPPELRRRGEAAAELACR